MTGTYSVRALQCLTVTCVSAVFVILCDSHINGMPSISMIGSPAIIGHEQEISCSISASTDTSETPFPLTWTRSDRPNETLNPFRTRTVRINNQVTFISLIKINVTFSDHDVTFTCTMTNGTSSSLTLLVIQPPEDPTISGPEYVNDTESYTWTCRVDGASFAPPRVQWFDNRGKHITQGVHTIFTDYWNQYHVRLFNVTSDLILVFRITTNQIFGLVCRSVHEASKITKYAPFFKITIEGQTTLSTDVMENTTNESSEDNKTNGMTETRMAFKADTITSGLKGNQSQEVTRNGNCRYHSNGGILLITICLIISLQNIYSLSINY